jgi:branched-chain amino acid transport system permease protein
MEAFMIEVYFFLEVLFSGLLTGSLYSLVALGFVLIFKASGVFNFAQGGMMLFAALSLVGFQEMLGIHWTIAFVLTVGVMIVLAWCVEKFVLGKLVNQEPIILFMATIGITFFLDGFGQTVWGSDIKTLDIGLPTGSIVLEGLPTGATFLGEIFLDELELVAGATAAALVFILAIFFNKTKVGRALRAVADDHQAAMSVGISLRTIWIIVWSVAGVVGLVAGIMWGTKLGVQFSLSLLALKALPVLMLGGFTSIPGAIIGGLIIGSGEKLAEIYLGPFVGGAIENWFAYMLAMLFLLFRPQGLFGEKIIERV